MVAGISNLDRPTKQEVAKENLRDASMSGRQSNRRSFTDEEKLSIALKAEKPVVSVTAACRRQDM